MYVGYSPPSWLWVTFQLLHERSNWSSLSFPSTTMQNLRSDHFHWYYSDPVIRIFISLIPILKCDSSNVFKPYWSRYYQQLRSANDKSIWHLNLILLHNLYYFINPCYLSWLNPCWTFLPFDINFLQCLEHSRLSVESLKLPKVSLMYETAFHHCIPKRRYV